jgi:hypothetical protein
VSFTALGGRRKGLEDEAPSADAWSKFGLPQTSCYSDHGHSSCQQLSPEELMTTYPSGGGRLNESRDYTRANAKARVVFESVNITDDRKSFGPSS